MKLPTKKTALYVELRTSEQSKKHTTFVQVNSFGEASETVRAFIEKHDLTAGCGSGGVDFTGGDIFMDGVKIAKVSYNGRVWTNDGKEWTR